jgi:cell fate regulator YaaT (PSP1 superfamily)
MSVHSDDVQTLPDLIAGVRFSEVGKLYHFACHHIPDLLVGDYVIVETTRGRQMGQVMQKMAPDPENPERDYKPILRKSTPTDLMSQQLWKTREVEALIVCREKAAELGGLDSAKFVAAQYNFDGTLLTIMFSAEDKLNTAKLRTALQRSFKAKIELRQIGPRDVAKLLGGMGACGIPRCCSTFLTDFSPISIKMAKAQGISLNPSEITGMCGRLRCCLIYEYEQYVEARKVLPKRNKRVGTPHGEGRVIDVHPLRDAVTVMVEDVRHVVAREDLIPLEEFEALKAKAEAGCSKHGDGPCDCGARTGKVEDDIDEDDEPIQAAPPTAAVVSDEEDDEPEEPTHLDEPPADNKPPRKGRPRRGKPRRSR